MSKWVLKIALVVVASFQYGAAQTDEFAMANKFYEEKDYDNAIRMYKSILAQGWESGVLYYNLGNACFKAGDLGHAVLYYMRAKRLAPSDEDVTHNLKFAKQFSRVRMEGVKLNPIHTLFASMVAPYRLEHLAWLSSAFFILSLLLMMLRYGFGFNNTLLRLAGIAGIVLLIVSVGLTSFKYREDYLTERGVIIEEECPVYTGASERSEVDFQAAAGLVVEIMEEDGAFWNVLFENKRRGWIRKDLVAEI